MNGPQSMQMKVDLSSKPAIECKCGSIHWKQVFEARNLSALESPSGKEMVLTNAILVCEKCNASLEDLLSVPKLTS